jgi:Na+/melibiose symporter-like transporter
MALDYDERTSLNTYRNAASTFGVAAAIGMRPLADALGGGVSGFAEAGVLVGVAMALPWLAVWKVSFERPNFRLRPVRTGFFEGLRIAGRHDTFQTLIGLYLCGRVAIDIMGAMLIVYFTYWIGRSADFEPLMLSFLTAGVLSLPIWLTIARHTDKAALFIVGSVWWAVSLLILFLADPDWPRWTMFVFAPAAGIGFAAVDLMPWSMVGDVIDEDDVATGERREGIYNGVFTFLRKLSGAIAVFVAFTTLDVLGFVKGQQQTTTVLWGIRILASVAPAVCLLLAIRFARRYRLTRHAHARILEVLRTRDAAR